jgi:hypothetical protein
VKVNAGTGDRSLIVTEPVLEPVEPLLSVAVTVIVNCLLVTEPVDV